MSESKWSQQRNVPRGFTYDERWQDLVDSGQNIHGEADFISGLKPSSVLDAGCGTGRVAIELIRRGIDCVGVDLDREMLAAASQACETKMHDPYAEADGGNMGRRKNGILVLIEHGYSRKKQKWKRQLCKSEKNK